MESPRRKRRSSFTAREKLRVARAVEASQNVRDIISEFYPGLSAAAYESRRKLVLRWLREKEKLEKQCSGKNGANKRKHRPVGVGTKLPEAAELDLVKWVNDLRKEGVPVSSKMLSIEAKDVAEEYGVVDFEASWRWARAFKARHKLSMRARTRQGQKTPADLDEIAAAFALKVRAAMLDLGVKKVFNADQTAVFFEFLPTRTLNKKGAKTVWVRCAGKTKERATVMLMGDSDGMKYRPFVVFKTKPSTVPVRKAENDRLRCGFSKKIWESLRKARREENLEIYSNQKGWWNSYLSIKFLQHHFTARSDMDVPILLLWNDFSGHWTEEVISYAKSINVVLMKVPPSATSVCQPADVAWNYPFKARLRGCWVDNLREQLRAHVSGTKFKLAAPARAEVSRWVRSAWDGLSATTVASGYKKAFGTLLDAADMAAADLIEGLASKCVIDIEVGEVQSDDDIGEAEDASDIEGAEDDEDAEAARDVGADTEYTFTC